MRIIFMGTPDFAVPVLESLITKHTVIAVYTQPPRPAGKGYHLTPSPVHQKAESLGIPVYTPKSLKNEEEQKKFAALNADAAVVCAYGLILPPAVLNAPRKGCINIHASLLPRWRGAAPVQRAVEAGDSESGVTIMQMDIGLDTGDMLLKKSCPITPETTGESLHDALSVLGAELILKALEENPQPQPQPAQGVTYAEKIQKDESLLDWNCSADQLAHKIMAFYSYPATFSFYHGERVKILKAHATPLSTDQTPGTILDSNLHIACGNGSVLQIDFLQRAGKKALSTADFMQSAFLKIGEKFCATN